MAACTFFGHRDCSQAICQLLEKTLTDLVENHGVNDFYVGSNGMFDSVVLSVLQRLKEKYSHISYCVVLAYPPVTHAPLGGLNYDNVVLPEGIEKIHPRQAINWRNRWMLDRCDYVVCYVYRDWGGAAQFVKKAEGKGKKVINLYAPEWNL